VLQRYSRLGMWDTPCQVVHSDSAIAFNCIQLRTVCRCIDSLDCRTTSCMELLSHCSEDSLRPRPSETRFCVMR
jgi:hypothetical protein